MKKNNFVVYTALFGKYDDLLKPAPSAHCDYVCFTDDPLLKSNIWEVRVVSSHLPENMMNRLYKTKPHVHFPNYKASIYVDSNIKILNDPIGLFNKYRLLFDIILAVCVIWLFWLKLLLSDSISNCSTHFQSLRVCDSSNIIYFDTVYWHGVVCAFQTYLIYVVSVL